MITGSVTCLKSAPRGPARLPRKRVARVVSNSRREREHPGNGPDWTPKRVEWGRNRALERSLGALAGAAAESWTGLRMSASIRMVAIRT